MKNLFRTLSLLAAILICISSASAITITNAGYRFGTADPSSPSNPTDETGRLVELIAGFNSLTAGQLAALPGTPVGVANSYDSAALTVYNNVGLIPTLSTVVSFEWKNEVGGENGFSFNMGGMSYEWLAIKQATLTTYYHIGGIGSDETVEYENAWSHYSLFNGTRVPDSGATLILLGGALAGLAMLRRRAN